MYQRGTVTQKGSLFDESAAGRLAAHEGLRVWESPYLPLDIPPKSPQLKRARTWLAGWIAGRAEVQADKTHWRKIHPRRLRQPNAPPTPTRNGGPSTNAMRREFHVGDRVLRDRGIAAARLRGLPKGSG